MFDRLTDVELDRLCRKLVQGASRLFLKANSCEDFDTLHTLYDVQNEALEVRAFRSWTTLANS